MPLNLKLNRAAPDVQSQLVTAVQDVGKVLEPYAAQRLWLPLPLNTAGGWNVWAQPGFRNAEYWKDPFGFVQLRGYAFRSGGSSNQNIGNLPPGFRPAQEESFAVATTTIAAPRMSFLDVLPDGTLFLVNTGSTDGYVSLSNIRFDAVL